MPHQCTKCGEVFPDAAEELLKGCSCGSKFFYYIRQEKMDQLQGTLKELENADKIQIEKDIREITGLNKKEGDEEGETEEKPVILDLERSEEHTSELQSHSFSSYAVFCLKKKNSLYTLTPTLK